MPQVSCRLKRNDDD